MPSKINSLTLLSADRQMSIVISGHDERLDTILPNAKFTHGCVARFLWRHATVEVVLSLPSDVVAKGQLAVYFVEVIADLRLMRRDISISKPIQVRHSG